MGNVIEVMHLEKHFGGKTAVKDLSFSVSKGEVFGLLGHNGAGKSTTIDCMLGLKSYSKGEVHILGMDPVKKRKVLFERVGVQLPHTSYQDKIKVGELCEENAVLYKNPGNYHELLEQFGLSKCKAQYVSTLSGGEKQKLSVLLALLPKPDVIFLDELTTGLDTLARREVWNQLVKLKKVGVTIFLTSHYMDEVEALCDNICIIKEGKKVECGPVKTVIEKSPYDSLEDAYLWYMGEEVVK